MWTLADPPVEYLNLFYSLELRPRTILTKKYGANDLPVRALNESEIQICTKNWLHPQHCVWESMKNCDYSKESKRMSVFQEEKMYCLLTFFLRCSVGSCLKSAQICNGAWDCPDGLDERNCAWVVVQNWSSAPADGCCLLHQPRNKTQLFAFLVTVVPVE